ncbi:MAG: hypothetical protein LQ346_006240 [Caloplaca aetnensis]|nr:MAG: hypothetical protein LQ346_006240 [Caloplaca aetnensis]
MCRLTTVASALLALAVINAAPLTTPPPNGDQCGPTVQIPGDPADTCKAQPTLVPPGGSPGAYSITPIASIVGPSTRYDPSTCDPVIDELCKTMAGANVTLGKWYFSSNEGTNEGTNEVGGPYGCQMGFYLPAQEGAAPKPATVGEDGNAGNQCKNILGAIRWAARGQPVTSTDFGAETVNLVMPPVGVEGMWPMLGDQNRGRTDGKYPDCLLSLPPHSLSHIYTYPLSRTNTHSLSLLTLSFWIPGRRYLPGAREDGILLMLV